MEVTGGYALKLDATAPAFDLPGTDGRRHRLDDARDAKALVVAFWCNHCPYVRAWERRFVAWARAATAAQGVAAFAISANDVKQYPQDGFDEMAVRAKEQDYSFPYLYDETQDVARAYGAQVTPHFFVFDARRHLVYQGRFDDNKDVPSAVQQRFVPTAVDAILGGRPILTKETAALGCSVKWKR
ncbi:MAG TPA: thioredoxin family protein [Candidatus Thermoplasmatota archaeon]|nr:thioredoxin family protein [Candidatus Thermoplasmatota archaeon]